MIFDGRSIYSITDGEIDALVTEHYCERQQLEYKVTVNNEDKLEILHDIASLANGGGGYIFIGIRDDGKGRAQKYEPILVGDIEAIKRMINDLSSRYILERIEGIEVVTREVKGNPLVIVRVPSSIRKPHMVTHQNRTDFYTRYNDGKKEMTLGEIREAFQKDDVMLALSEIKGYLKSIKKNELDEKGVEIIKQIESGETPSLLTIEDGSQLSAASFKLFLREVGDAPFLWMGVTPDKPRSDLINVDSAGIKKILVEAPGSRRSGWNMENSDSAIERIGIGVQRGSSNYEYLRLLVNGHMEFWSPLDDHFCWRQSDEEYKRLPRLYPYPLTEYPVTFLRLYKALIDVAPINDTFIINLRFVNLKGYIIRPGAPNSIIFDLPDLPTKPFPNQHLDVPQKKVSSDFDPDKVAYELVKFVYASFNLDTTAIPFYNAAVGRFDWPV